MSLPPRSDMAAFFDELDTVARARRSYEELCASCTPDQRPRWGEFWLGWVRAEWAAANSADTLA